MSYGAYDDEGRWVWNCTCDPGPEGQHQWYCATNCDEDGRLPDETGTPGLATDVTP